MKLSTIAVGATHTVHVKDAKGELMFEGGDPNKPVQIVVYGPGTKQYRKAKADQQNRLLALLQKRGAAAKITPEAKAQQDAEFLADVTASMQYIEADDAEGRPLSGRDLFMAVYSNPAVGYIAEQVHAEVHDWANF